MRPPRSRTFGTFGMRMSRGAWSSVVNEPFATLPPPRTVQSYVAAISRFQTSTRLVATAAANHGFSAPRRVTDTSYEPPSPRHSSTTGRGSER